LKDIYVEFSLVKKEFSKNRKDLKRFKDRNSRLESQLEETLNLNGSLQTRADVYKQELAEEKRKNEQKTKIIEVMKNTENNVSSDDKSCTMCIA